MQIKFTKEDELKKEIGERVAVVRKQLDLSMAIFGKLLTVAPSYIHSIESGEKMINPLCLYRMYLLGVDCNWLLTGVGYVPDFDKKILSWEKEGNRNIYVDKLIEKMERLELLRRELLGDYIKGSADVKDEAEIDDFIKKNIVGEKIQTEQGYVITETLDKLLARFEGVDKKVESLKKQVDDIKKVIPDAENSDKVPIIKSAIKKRK